MSAIASGFMVILPSFQARRNMRWGKTGTSRCKHFRAGVSSLLKELGFASAQTKPGSLFLDTRQSTLQQWETLPHLTSKCTMCS
ncbi:hypothetical protein BDQ12DRAFT_256397 [Crucibulum laeve]|uniref:Uncharacterized protein n=1 Tax=Crucibulum laeve TaxID=68775 RepID=A0A5C3LV67_9AGAR|nr:hypothetical protein BDQ12DRAFT_256397 [Crucibulum laeve]